ncbi:MAG: DUF362 domain-containing protein [Victivallales bacterium]|nr:DUF362 domain-containing protein [Victivallales bacterium]MCF7888706.1 DUF362 domain-containing protein [Victivallales bacterium]
MNLYSDLKHLAVNPLIKHTGSDVVIAHGRGPYENTVSALEKFDLTVLKNKRVLLKPNAGRLATSDKGVTTHPLVVAAAIDIFRSYGADVSVGESPISGVNTMEAFEVTGIKEEAEKRDCPLLDMDERKYVNAEIPDGIVLKRMKVCPEIFEFDIIVSIPVIKTHMHTGATLSIKNMKGCLWRRSKVKLHMLPVVEGHKDKPIDIAISDMASVLKPHLSVIDGTVCMQGMGPSAGKPCPMDLVVVGADPFAADAVTARLMGFEPDDIPHLRLCSERKLGSTAVDKLNIYPENWGKLAENFDVPPANLSISYPNIIIHDKNSCSACQSTLYLFLKRYGNTMGDYCSKNDPLHLAIGKGNSDLPPGTVCIGNCTRSSSVSGEYISGCPPVASEILSTITGRHVYDTKDGKL